MPELADTSVWAVRRNPAVAPWWQAQMRVGEIGICDMVKVELLHSARTGQEFTALRRNLSGMPSHLMSAHAWSRALDVFEVLAHVGPQHHRSIKPADLIIAACAEESGWLLVHYDQDYDAIASVTGQPTQWVAPRGTL